MVSRIRQKHTGIEERGKVVIIWNVVKQFRFSRDDKQAELVESIATNLQGIKFYKLYFSTILFFIKYK